jgi:hypothetical protein
VENKLADSNGFLTKWLICGPKLNIPEIVVEEEIQEKFESKMREAIPDDNFTVPMNIYLDETCSGQNWKYWYGGNGIFVDISNFYRLICRVEFYGATQIKSSEACELQLCLWCYPATDVWVNGEKVLTHEAAVYKPMRRAQTSIKLKKGINDIFVRCQNLGVRDTRNIYGMQLIGELSGIENILPDKDGNIRQLTEAADWLDSLKLKEAHLLFAKSAPPVPCTIEMYTELPHKSGKNTICISAPWENGSSYDFAEGYKGVKVIIFLHGQSLVRSFEIMENEKPVYQKVSGTIAEHRKNVIALTGELKKKIDSDNPMDTGVYYVLARMATNGGFISEDDKAILLHDLDFVDACSDCSDFALSALLRLFMTYDVEDQELQERMKQVVLRFRYWMDEEGSDGMCFWSENHTLLFHGCQMVAGLLYPNEIFSRSGRTGIEMNLLGNKRCSEWLDIVEKKGFEEFLSAGYMCVTAAAILELVDFADEIVQKRAEALLIKLLEQLSRHALNGSTIGPMGRVYREVIIPHKQEIQAIIHYINPEAPQMFTAWLAPFATSHFVIPDHLTDLMKSQVSTVYNSGNAEICLVKTDNYLLSSVSSPRSEEELKSSMTLFEPGLYGYQQHMWYAALDNDCIAFINHPGATNDESEMRPGYWYGNGLMPALMQKGRILGGIYHLDQKRHPVNFTHLYWPSFSLEEEVLEGNWLFGRKGKGYLAIWSSVQGKPFDDVLSGCEYRFVSECSAFICMTGSKQEDGEFTDFMLKAKNLNPVFALDGMSLEAGGEYHLVYVPTKQKEKFV